MDLMYFKEVKDFHIKFDLFSYTFWSLTLYYSLLASREVATLIWEVAFLHFYHIPGKQKCYWKDRIADEILHGNWEWKVYMEEMKNAVGLHVN